MNYRLSIIIPLLRDNSYLNQAIQSVLEYDGEDLECHVVKNREPEPNPLYIAAVDKRLLTHHVSTNSLAGLINAGVHASSGSIVGILSPDAIFEPNALKNVLKHFETHGDSRILYGQVHNNGSKSQSNRRRSVRPPTPSQLQDHACLQSSAVFYRRSVLEAFGQFDEKLEHWAHYELWIRLIQAGVTFDGTDFCLARNQADERDALDELRKESVLEALDLTKTKFGSPGTRWAILYGHCMATEAGVSPMRSASYDYLTLSHAFRAMGQASHTGWQGWSRKWKILRQHAFSELNKIRRKPRYMIRFLPLPAKERIQNSFGRRVFQLRFDAPQPCRLPKSYFTPINLENPPKISIVTPSLNQGTFIARTIRSVVDQEYPNLEYTIQDACSTDESLNIVARYETKLASWQSIRDNGQAHAINLGLARTNGEIMAYLNSDDVLLPGSLAYVAKFFQEHPDVDVVYGNRLLIDEQDRVINYWVLPPHDPETLRWTDYVPQETLFWRRSAWDRIGSRIDESFQFAMDWDLLLRFQAEGLRFCHIPRFLGGFRITDRQKTQQLLESHGRPEMNRLRTREHGYCPAEHEVSQKVTGYITRQRSTEKAYRLSEAVNRLITPYVEWNLGTSVPEPIADDRSRAA
ncbi:MAG: glycosyltransferase [Pirellulaceae bacterium]|nr:glycosyltransferase [Pirellulaceae bacterium]